MVGGKVLRVPPLMFRLKGTEMADSPVVAFHDRRNDDGTITSICLNCYRTVAYENDPSEAIDMQRAHVCEERHIRRTQDAAVLTGKRSIASPSYLTRGYFSTQKKKSCPIMAGQPMNVALSAA